MALTAFANIPRLSHRAELDGAPVRYPRPSRAGQPLRCRRRQGRSRRRQALGLDTVGDLLEHLPRDRREARTVAELVAGESATVVVEVRSIASRPVRRRGMRPLVEATVADASGHDEGDVLQPAVAGPAVSGRARGWCCTASSRRATASRVQAHARTDRGRAPAASGGRALPGHRGALLDPDPRAGARARAARSPTCSSRCRPRCACAERLPDRADALSAVHFPATAAIRRAAGAGWPSTSCCSPSSRCCAAARLRDAGGAAPVLDGAARADRALAGRDAAVRAHRRPASARWRRSTPTWRAPRPMQRLLMGEVGSGKTVVALYALLRAVEHGYQGALMAPTETLAEQHFATIQALMPGEAVPVGLLTGSTPGAPAGRPARQARQRRAVADRRHPRADRGRRAVRRAWASRSSTSSTASACASAPRWTPRAPERDAPARAAHDRHADPAHAGAARLRGPRLHRCCASCPRGRQPIADARLLDRARARPRLRAHPRGAARRAARRSSSARWWRSPRCCRRAPRPPSSSGCATGELRDFRVVLMHGQLRPAEKQAAMAAFASGGADVLVATSVIEVGIDVPNATVMLVEDADRYGISQLHQLRGRIGRGEHASLCLLFGPKDSPRLRALADAHATASSWPRSTSSCAARASWSAPGSTGWRSSASPSCPRDAELLERARIARRADRRRGSASCDCPSTRCWPTRWCAPTAPRRWRRSASVRVIAGPIRRAARWSRPAAGPPGPTSDRVREALFSILGDVDGARVLDLFAGSGALAIEALSRGAAQATLVDSSAAAVAAIRRNLAALGAEAEVRPPAAPRRSSSRHVRDGRQYDLVFLDPPYRHASGLGRELSAALAAAARSRSAGRRRERPAGPARARAGAARRAPLRRHPDPNPWLPITASPSAPAPSTRSPTVTST